MPNSEQISECRLVCAKTPLREVDEQHGQIGGRGTGRHVARVLLVPRAVGNNKGTAGRRKKTIRDIDRDALLPLVFEPIEQQREIDIAAGRAKAPRLLFQRGELVAR